MKNKQGLPDITSQSGAQNGAHLKWVGMEKIAVPLSLTINQQLHRVNASADIFVSLDKGDRKGIHMSRLYRLLNTLSDQTCQTDTIEALLAQAVESQMGISDNSRVVFSFDIAMNKPALLSGESGFQSYPIELQATRINGQYHYQLSLTVAYSSTCPCSASLAQQLMAQEIDLSFKADEINKSELLAWLQSSKGSVATPHSQRSYAYLTLNISADKFKSYWQNLTGLILQIEEVMGTPVQTAVKRLDEQEFARLNAKNLMFCEDAARRLKAMLESVTDFYDYQFKIEHQESLHAHNAVVIDQKHA